MKSVLISWIMFRYCGPPNIGQPSQISLNPNPMALSLFVGSSDSSNRDPVAPPHLLESRVITDPKAGLGYWIRVQGGWAGIASLVP